MEPPTTADRIDAIKKKLLAKHTDETYFYTSCNMNCGASCCVNKVRVKDGKITAIEPDDRINSVGREDEILSDRDLTKNRLNQRGCPFVYAFGDMLYHSERVLHPMKRVEGTKRGEGKFEQISWDEALSIIAREMRYCKEHYGPYSIIVPFMEHYYWDILLGHFGCGVQGWGWCSMDAERLSKFLMLGRPGWVIFPDHDMADMLLNTKMIILWGGEPTVQHWGPGHQFAYFIKMARERGKPVICVDPVYTIAAQVLADQWIPIKPGTDMAMMAGVAYVLFKEGLYNKEFVEKWVEPKGFEMWRNYIMGSEKSLEFPYNDGCEKSPEWAEKICGVPAETITEFATLYAKMKPTYLFKNWSVARKSHGENVARAALALQAMMGYMAGPGGCMTNLGEPGQRNVNSFSIALRTPFSIQPKKVIPRMYRSNKWAQAILLLDKVEKGELTTEEYRRIIGWKAPQDLPNPNPKMMLRGGPFYPGTNPLVTGCDSTNDQIRAMNKLRFVAWMGSYWTPTMKYADIVLPTADQTFESGPQWGQYNYGGFSNNIICPGTLKPQGESKHTVWIFTKIAEKLGFPHFFNTYYTTDENWETDWDRYMNDSYRRVREDMERFVPEYGGKIDKPLPEWDEFKKGVAINQDSFFDEPWHACVDEIDRGKGFGTKSGKIEFCSSVILDESQRGEFHVDHRGIPIDNLPSDWRDLTAMPVYQPCVHGMEEATTKYPLMMLTSHSRYRAHSWPWLAPRLRGDVYRHAVWLSVADAKSRGIDDGDSCRVYNDRGEVLIPAYVTSRIMPGVVLIRHGAYYDPDAFGRDRGGSAAVLLFDDKSPTTPGHVTNLVQVEKWEGRSE